MIHTLPHRLALTTLACVTLAAPALAESHAMGDAAAGEKEFRKCKACHMIASDDEVIMKGGKTGPNLYGVIGRAAGSVEDFRYSSLMEAAATTGLVWDAENLVPFLEDPTKYLQEVSGEKGRSKMSLKLRKGAEDVVAYLASVGPEMAEGAAATDEAADGSANMGANTDAAAEDNAIGDSAATMSQTAVDVDEDEKTGSIQGMGTGTGTGTDINN